ncbi:MAG: RNA polymerase-associated protein RapA [Verrucomicrobiales bacterium]|nr:RNA polymerase-associated protein RapA [Verrucomicrobiales bacterium]
MMSYLAGQRWVSEAEPELGLGVVVRTEGGRVWLRFAAAGEDRQYAMESAPLRRVAFRPGETVCARQGEPGVVAAVAESRGLLRYQLADGRSIVETELQDTLGFGTPEDRLLAGRTDPWRTFELRREALVHQHRLRSSPVRGFVGGRMDLIPHQLYIAREVTGRLAPRVLLADEVGLGKTVEACLILHRLLATGRASRVLVIVPEPLVHQWFVELLRRFNLWFHIFDEERCEAIQAVHPDANPFLDDQLVLCALPFLLDSKRGAQAVEAGWDMLVVDEAHHLGWTPEAPSPEYQVVEQLSRKAESLLLLTATPEQLGVASHYGRLRLLDPDRYYDLAKFEAEMGRYAEVASIANKLSLTGRLGTSETRQLHGILGAEPGVIQERLEALARGDAEARRELVVDLLDRHGTGRVMFRNTRAAIRGFPRRQPNPVRLPGDDHSASAFEAWAREFELDNAPRDRSRRGPGPEYDFTRDPRVEWLAGLLRRLAGKKVLLICRSREKVMAIDRALRGFVTVPTALFHEDLDLVQRDRNAAWFAEPDGAQILLASEIGSEGRNFQFAHHLVLFDLPLDPELIEQRIGRLDRIGQTSNIQIHVPYVVGSPQEVLFRWYHDGLAAFGHNLVAGRELRERFGRQVRDLAMDFHETHASRGEDLQTLVTETQVARRDLEHRLEQGRDRLLELNSFRAETAREVVEAVAGCDRDTTLEDFLLRVFDHYGVAVEELGLHRFKLGSDGVFADAFPGMPTDGLVLTFDRQAALAREDLAFMTWDHPLVSGALDLLLGAPEGSSACVRIVGGKTPGLWLETIHVLECVAPSPLHADRFLPATPIRVIVDARQNDVTDKAVEVLAKATVEDLPAHEVTDQPSIRQLVAGLARAAGKHAETRKALLVQEASAKLHRFFHHELERLRALAAVNSNVRPLEIAGWEDHFAKLREHVGAARLRLDSVRLIVLGEW